MTESSYSLHKCGIGCRCLYKGLPEMLTDYYIHLYTHHHELMFSVGSHGSSSLLFVMKLMDTLVCDFHKVMIMLILYYLQSVIVVEISLQSHRYASQVVFFPSCVF
jgi:hypothetical protein